jgi:chromosomal replication initiator protein
MSKDVLSTVLRLLAEKIGGERYDLWFGARTRFTLNGSNLLVETPNRFLQDWQRQHYRGAVEAACREALGSGSTGSETTSGDAVAVDFRVNEALNTEALNTGQLVVAEPTASGEGQPSGNATEDHRKEKHSRCVTAAAGMIDGARNFAEQSHRELQQKAEFADGEIAQAKGTNLIPRLGNGLTGEVETTTPRRRFATLAAFVIGASNRLAHTSAQIVAERPGSMTPLLVYGPHGTGKTHLLEAIWSAARTQNPKLNCVYLSAEQFTTFYVGAARGGGMPSFRRKYRAADLLLIDDLQFLTGKKGTLVELLHTIDTALRDGRQLVFAADRAPAELSGLGPELSTRLAGGMVCQLESPDLQTRFGLAQQFGRRLGIELAEDVAEFIATQITAGAREICGAVKRLHAASRMLQCSIDRDFAQEYLTDLLRHAGRAVRLADIEQAVCNVFQLPKESLQSQRRAKQVSAPRMLAMWLARKYTRAGLAEIGEYFGRRSHSTVISAHKRVTGWIDGQSEIELTDSRCKVDEALRRVEAQLRTA